MTSKRLFFNVMKEDLRHKTWMLVLSFLGNFMAFPIAWLLFNTNLSSLPSPDMSIPQMFSLITEFFCNTAVYIGGAVAVAGAFIVGLFSFRYLFHKNMVDTWHSMPIKRGTLYAAGYVEGILIWFVPFLINLLVTTLMAGHSVYQYGGMQTLGALLKEVIITAVTIITVYLLAYHLILVAVMLCGNIMNVLVSIVILGFGAISVFVVGVGICSYYLDTFSDFSYSFQIPGYASPLFSALYLLYSRAHSAGDSIYAFVNTGVADGRVQGITMRVGFGDLGRGLCINLIVAVLLGLCAWFLYQKRESELAQQGIKIKALAAFFRIFAGVAAGMGGWMLFILLMINANKMSLSWSIFGAVLGSILVFGVLDIIFEMDSKRFFAHKLQMGITVCLSLLTGLAIHGDWFGYDKYLPEKDEIEGIAVYNPYFENRSFYGGVQEAYFDGMNFSDAEVIYAYLERMTAKQHMEQGTDYDSVTVKVKLKNNSSYYREYQIYEEDKDVIWPILTSEEYLQAAYVISEDEMEGVSAQMVGAPGRVVHLEDYEQAEMIPIIKAYNQDVLADPERTLTGRGILLSSMYVDIENNKSPAGYISAKLDIYDTMENTLEALKQAGFGEAAAMSDLSGISSVELLLWIEEGADTSPEAVIEQARQYYGVFAEEQSVESEEEAESRAEKAEYYGIRERKQVSVADREEIEELLPLISRLRPNPSGSVFEAEWVEIAMIEDGKEHYCYIPWGALPEKYIHRFGEL